MHLMKKISVVLMLLVNSHLWAFVTVGSDPDCDYDNLFTAYNDLDPEIRVTNQVTHSNNFVFQKIKHFKGGYDNCQDAETDTVGAQKSRWSGLNGNNNTVIELDVDLAIQITVIMERFEIFDGNNTTAAAGGGIKIKGNSRMILRDSVIYDNTGQEGGGIHVSGDDAVLTLESTLVENNTANGFGGGIFCTSGARVSIDEFSAIRLNEANFNGGGLYADQECFIENSAGRSTPTPGANGVAQNNAAKGAGVYLQTGADYVSTGSTEFPAIIYLNNANQVGEAGGGGIFATGQGTEVTLTNTQINSNTSLHNGGGMVVADFASLDMSQNAAGCTYSDTSCSSLSSNYTVGGLASGGAGFLADSADVRIAQTLMRGNRSNQIAVFDVNDDANLTLEGTLVIDSTDLTQGEAQYLFTVRGEAGQTANIDFAYSTIADNEAANIFLVNGLINGQSLSIYNSIIWDSGDVMVASGNNNQIQIDCSVVHENQSLQGNVGPVLTNDPLFVDAANDDYSLDQNSDAIDLCDQMFYQAEHPDMRNQARGVDISTVNNFLGPYDAGAFEFTGDIIFQNGFD